ncbi:hypothetical protein K438DRAFT_1774148 [Mycena galopus ATCC 62051]|nr:hypothetical protein K438DRAFT_1774148 [Mycena galopus ATCC 62051]
MTRGYSSRGSLRVREIRGECESAEIEIALKDSRVGASKANEKDTRRHADEEEGGDKLVSARREAQSPWWAYQPCINMLTPMRSESIPLSAAVGRLHKIRVTLSDAGVEPRNPDRTGDRGRKCQVVKAVFRAGWNEKSLEPARKMARMAQYEGRPAAPKAEAENERTASSQQTVDLMIAWTEGLWSHKSKRRLSQELVSAEITRRTAHTNPKLAKNTTEYSVEFAAETGDEGWRGRTAEFVQCTWEEGVVV